jgi:hypothetical protein
LQVEIQVVQQVLMAVAAVAVQVRLVQRQPLQHLLVVTVETEFPH